MKLGSNDSNKQSNCYIIAEAGVNHNGDINLALQLADEAKKAGADCVKYQTFKAERIITRNAPKAEYQLRVTDAGESQFEMLKSLELDANSYDRLVAHCKDIGIDFLSTPYNHEDADFLEDLGVQAFKIASGQLIELNFLRHVALKNKPLLISTGMATMAEIAEAVETIRATGNEQLIVLQCTTNYPSSLRDANIRAMTTIQNAFKCQVGYSDHVPDDYACYAAVALGAKVIEKHFTLDTSMNGPDHSSSLDPAGFSKLVHGIRAIEMSLGSFIKSPTDAEISNSVGMRRSVATRAQIKKGEVFTLENTGFKRPATGLPPKMLDDILNKKSAVDIHPDTIIQPWMIDWSD